MPETPTPIHRGKVRDTYNLGPGRLLVIATDRMSIFDVVLPQPFAGRGAILTAMTRFWLTESPLAAVAPNHLLPDQTLPDWAWPYRNRALVVRQASMLPVEWIVRSHLVGSAWREYELNGTMHGQRLPPGMQECQELPTPVLTPSTKAQSGSHDRNISLGEAAELVGGTTVRRVEEICLTAYNVISLWARQRGVVMLDTKLELGIVDGQIIICDEVFTPDSSRFVLADQLKVGRPPVAYDKEMMRQWGRYQNFTGEGEPPNVPGWVIRGTLQRYRDICTRLTGDCPV